jgi:hypothetical protein
MGAKEHNAVSLNTLLIQLNYLFMKSTLKAIFTMSILLMLTNAFCQGTGANAPMKKAAIGNSVAIELKNLCEKDVRIFAGRRDELKNPKSKEKVYGGLSTNTIYASVNEVVCIINDQGKPTSCTNVKTGVTEVEVNKSGTVITGK